MNQKLPENISKLLVYCSDTNYLSYRLGQYRIYLENHKLIHSNEEQLIPTQPSVAKVRFHFDEQILDFIRDKDPKSVRIFKSVKYHNQIPLGFIYNSGKNFLGLLQSKHQIRIIGDHKDQFYKIFNEINDEWKFGHTFDYDEWDVTFVIKTFKDYNNKITVVYFYSKVFPNQ